MKALSNREVFEVIVNADRVIGDQFAKLPFPSKSRPLPLITHQNRHVDGRRIQLINLSVFNFMIMDKRNVLSESKDN
jgi:hypothetical protein